MHIINPITMTNKMTAYYQQHNMVKQSTAR